MNKYIKGSEDGESGIIPCQVTERAAKKLTHYDGNPNSEQLRCTNFIFRNSYFVIVVAHSDIAPISPTEYNSPTWIQNIG